MYFFKGTRYILSDLKADDAETDVVKKEILQVFDVKNLSFLIGAGCSSYQKGAEKKEIGVPVMSELAREFYSKVIEAKDKDFITNTVKIDVENEPFNNNLEKFMEVLHSYLFLLA